MHDEKKHASLPIAGTGNPPGNVNQYEQQTPFTVHTTPVPGTQTVLGPPYTYRLPPLREPSGDECQAVQPAAQNEATLVARIEELCLGKGILEVEDYQQTTQALLRNVAIRAQRIRARVLRIAAEGCFEAVEKGER